MKTKQHPIPSTTVIQSGGGQAPSPAIPRKWSALALGGFLFTSIFALSPPSVEAQCQQWNVGHAWRLKQGSLNVDVDLHQKGSAITGTAGFEGRIGKGGSGLLGSFGESGTTHGTVSGIVKGDHFEVYIYWANNTVGVYNGTIGPSGRIEGIWYNQASPSVKVNWHSRGAMVCADADIPQPAAAPAEQKRGVVPGPEDYKKLQDEVNKAKTPPPPRPIKFSGRMPKTQFPTISANPIAVPVPDGQSQGRTTLTWNAGPDHPDAQVWMKMGIDGEETLVGTSASGTRVVAVERGKNYQFLLKDADQQLAKAVAIGKR